jgi:hypothetical protein
MGKTFGYILAAVGMATLSFFSMIVGADAQSIENGVGVLCDSPAQVEQFIKLGADSQAAVAQINAQSKSLVCEILNVAFLVGGIVAESSNDIGTWQIRRILVVGVIIGRSTSPVQPYQKYTAFIISKASPI